MFLQMKNYFRSPRSFYLVPSGELHCPLFYTWVLNPSHEHVYPRGPKLDGMLCFCHLEILKCFEEETTYFILNQAPEIILPILVLHFIPSSSS